MAEATGLIGVIGVAVQLIELAAKFGLDWKDAPREARDLIDELQTLKTVLSETHVNLLCNDDFRDAFRGRHSALLSELDPLGNSDTMAMVSGCRRELEGLLEDVRGKAHGRRLGWERLKGAFQAARTRDSVQKLHRKCHALNQLLHVDVAAIAASTYREVKQARREQQRHHLAQARALDHLRERSDDEEARRERDKILGWLTPVDYAPQHADYLGRRQPGTGRGLLDSKAFGEWMATPGRTLFCYGIPGAGKTIIAAMVVDHLEAAFVGEPDVGIAYVYCNFRRHDEQRAEDLLLSLLKQLARQRPSVPEVVRALHAKSERSHSRPSVDEIADALGAVAAEYSRVFILVDALDECQTDGGCRIVLLTRLFDLQSASGVSANLFATSRPVSDVMQRFQGLPSLEILASREDIERYVRGHFSELAPFVGRRPDLQEEIVAGISNAAGGMFLLALLFFQSLKDKTTPTKVRKGLAQLREQSDGPGEDQKLKVLRLAYEQAMERISGQLEDHRDLALRVLSWITCAMRPLTSTELQHALSVEPGDEDPDEDNLPEVEDMVSVCAGLVTVEDGTGIIRLVHYTTQEYLSKTHQTWFPDAESYISRTCATYLSFNAFGAGACPSNDAFEARLRAFPFYLYAAVNWAHHARTAPDVSDELLGFLKSRQNTDAACQALALFEVSAGFHAHAFRYLDELSKGHPMVGLHLAAYFGLGEAMQRLLETGMFDVNSVLGARTPLMVAAEHRQLDVVRLLLATDGIEADPVQLKKTVDPFFYTTALHLAVEYGHEGVVRTLLDSGKFDVCARDGRGFTPLELAAMREHESIARMLSTTS